MLGWRYPWSSPTLPRVNQRSLRKTKIAAVLVVVGVLVVAQRFGIFQAFADPVRVKQTLVQLGPWGYVAFIAAYTVLQPFGVPGRSSSWPRR